jgi:hypothetical protein
MDGWYVKSVAVYKAIETDCTFWWSSGISGDCERCPASLGSIEGVLAPLPVFAHKLSRPRNPEWTYCYSSTSQAAKGPSIRSV